MISLKQSTINGIQSEYRFSTNCNLIKICIKNLWLGIIYSSLLIIEQKCIYNID